MKSQIKGLHSRIDELMGGSLNITGIAPARLSNFNSLQSQAPHEAKKLLQLEDKIHSLEDRLNSANFKSAQPSALKALEERIT